MTEETIQLDEEVAAPGGNDARALRRVRKPAGRALPWEVLRVWAPPGNRRVPLALALVRIGALRVTVGMVRLRRCRIAYRWPVGPDGASAVQVPCRLRERIEAAVSRAIRDDPEASAAIRPRW